MKSIKIKNTLKIENKNLSYPKTILSRPPKSRSVGFLETRNFLGGGGLDVNCQFYGKKLDFAVTVMWPDKISAI